jgi:hypothetical protein
VVPELGGTTTVVLFCGGGGLLLLIQPASSSGAAMKRADKIFMKISPEIAPMASLEPSDAAAVRVLQILRCCCRTSGRDARL